MLRVCRVIKVEAACFAGCVCGRRLVLLVQRVRRVAGCCGFWSETGVSVEIAVLSIFCAALLSCVAANLSILYALGFGLLLFLGYGKARHHTWRDLGAMVFSGIRTVGDILIVFLLIGVLTAMWRTSGTLPVVIGLAMNLVQPHLMPLLAFLLNCAVSVLTGTAFGTAATMGVICMTMANSMGIDPLLTGGAILSGVFFGDRCSPVSTSALLVSKITHTNLFTNIRHMVRTAAIPFALACLVYGVLGLVRSAGSSGVNVAAIFAREFDMGWYMVLPAVVMLVLAVLKVSVKIAMGISILLAAVFSYVFQGASALALLRAAIIGFSASDGGVGQLLNGGGVVSMLNVAAIVCLSSAYAGIFARTGLLAGVLHLTARLESRVGDFAAMLLTSIAASMVACNQTLAIMLTDQLCGVGGGDSASLAGDSTTAVAAESGVVDVSGTSGSERAADVSGAAGSERTVSASTTPHYAYDEKVRERKALNLEDSAVVVCPLIPWSIAGAVPLASVGAPQASILAACFLYLLPLCRVVWQLWTARRARREPSGFRKIRNVFAQQL